jgi:hypothetical protein
VIKQKSAVAMRDLTKLSTTASVQGGILLVVGIGKE